MKGDEMTAVLETSLTTLKRRHGKVRDLYDVDDKMIMVATDRISAFDQVFPNGVPDKGRVLTGISLFWFNHLNFPNHVISTQLSDMPDEIAQDPQTFAGRTILCRKVKVVPIECVIRGYLAGSGWKEYQKQGTVCGQTLPSGLVESDNLPEPIFTPATKAETGHDENISVEQMAEIVGQELTDRLKEISLDLYRRAAEYASSRGIILADTKLEFGQTPDGELILIDEIFTPDSSRFWPVDEYRPGGSPKSFDKQPVRDWLESIHFDKNSTPPEMPPEIIEQTRSRYVEAFEKLTGEPFDSYLSRSGAE